RGAAEPGRDVDLDREVEGLVVDEFEGRIDLDLQVHVNGHGDVEGFVIVGADESHAGHIDLELVIEPGRQARGDRRDHSALHGQGERAATDAYVLVVV